MPIALYSTNTWLAYAVAELYYEGVHWVWCSPFFDGRQEPLGRLPPSSSPAEIFDTLSRAVDGRDRHSDAIKRNRLGIRRGAAAKRADSVITASQEQEVKEMIRLADFSDFRPLLFVVPWVSVEADVIEVPPAERAHPASPEYRLEALHTDRFDVISPGRGRL